MPLIINDQSLIGVFGANCYLTQNVLFEYFIRDALLYSSSDLFIRLIVHVFTDFLRDIHSRDDDDNEGQEEELRLD